MEKRCENTVNDKLAFKAGILYLIAELFTRSISFLTTPVFTRMLPVAVFADVKIFESWTYLLAPVISISLYQSIARAKFDYGQKYSAYLSSILFLMAAITTAAGAVLFFIRGTITALLGFSSSLLFLMLLYCLSYNSIQCVQMYERQQMHYKSNIFLTMLAVIPSVVISVLCVAHFSGSVSDDQMLHIRIVSFFLPTTLLGLVVIVYSMIKGKTFVNKGYWRYGIKYSLPMMAAALSTQVFFQSDKIMVRNIYGAELAAIVALATTVGYIMDIFIHAIDNAWRPWLFEQLNTKGNEAITKLWKLLFGTVALLVWSLTMLAPELVFFLGGEKYKAAVWIIAPILCGSLANFLMITYTGLEQYYKITRVSGYISVVAAVANLILNYICLLAFGYQAAAYTTVACYLFACVLHFSYLNKNKKTDVLCAPRCFLLFGVTFVLCMFSTLLFRVSFWIRWGILLAVLLLVAVIGGKALLPMLKLLMSKKDA